MKNLTLWKQQIKYRKHTKKWQSPEFLDRFFCGEIATEMRNYNYGCTLNCVTKQVKCEKLVVFLKNTV